MAQRRRQTPVWRLVFPDTASGHAPLPSNKRIHTMNLYTQRGRELPALAALLFDACDDGQPPRPMHAATHPAPPPLPQKPYGGGDGARGAHKPPAPIQR
jgi:hypothetical protein